MTFKDSIRNFQHSVLDFFSGFVNLYERADKFAELFQADLDPGSSVLDIGSGSGIYYSILKSRGMEVTLLDVIRFKSCPFPVTLYDGRHFPFADESVDTSLLVTVLHHTSDPLQILKEAARVSRKNVIVIEDIYESFLGGVITRIRDMFFNFEYVGHPLQFRSAKDWEKDFLGLGYSLVRVEKFYSYLLGIPIYTGLFVLRPQGR